MNIYPTSGLCLAVLALLSTGLHAQNTNGTGGGAWDAPGTWASGVVRTPAQNFNILADDTVTANNSDVIQANNSGSHVRGTLTIGSGTTLTMGRLNNTSDSYSGTLNINGGVMSVSRYLWNTTYLNSSNFTLNITAGSFIIRETQSINMGINIDHTVNISGGLMDINSLSWTSGAVHLTGGTLLLRNNVSALTALDVGSWNGGAIALAGTMGSSPGGILISKWISNASNVLRFSTDDSIAQSLTLDSDISSMQGILSFNLYSSLSNNNDKLIMSGSRVLSLGEGVTLDIQGMNLPGSITDYVGASYQFFQVNDYSSITPVVPNSTINVGGTDYEVSWNTSNLAIDGTVTLVPEPSTYALVLGMIFICFISVRRVRATIIK